MKIAALALTLFLGVIFYLGDFQNSLVQQCALSEPFSLKNWALSCFDPEFKRLNSEVVDVKPADTKQIIRENGAVEIKAADLIVKDQKVAKPLGLEVFAKEKSAYVAQTMWLESHKVDDGGERLMIDKFHNLLSTGEWK